MRGNVYYTNESGTLVSRPETDEEYEARKKLIAIGAAKNFNFVSQEDKEGEALGRIQRWEKSLRQAKRPASVKQAIR